MNLVKASKVARDVKQLQSKKKKKTFIVDEE
jgi:hypothetical protein